MDKKIFFVLSLILLTLLPAASQHSVARLWNEKVLDAIRADFARPTIHARNLFHTSMAMYDAWAVYENNADTYFLGKTLNGYTCPVGKIISPPSKKEAQEMAMSYAVYRLLLHRFENAPRSTLLFIQIEDLMKELGYNPAYSSMDYQCSAAAMGNYIAHHIIQYGLSDGSNEAEDYANRYYETVNPSLLVEIPGNPDYIDLNRWQSVFIPQFIDQGGNPIGSTPEFLSPEWGEVYPFSLQNDDLTLYNRDGYDYHVYHDPGPPAYLDTSMITSSSDDYKWGHSLVSLWSSHLDPSDGVIWDISPASIGNIQEYPKDIAGLRSFYDATEGGDPGLGHTINPKTGYPYQQQFVPRGDYARVLAEFWADGPDSETPPGHWFTILNYVNDQPGFEKKFEGEGEPLDDLEWDVKSYFILGGAMHDVAITSWGIKGWYDYVRPVSAIRGMAELGQSSDPDLPNYHPGGIPLVEDYIEIIESGDPLEGANSTFVGEIKLKAWKGPSNIEDPNLDVAGVGWILAKSWYPYQRPSFVTPPFAGYVSGHSTYSRAAAEVLTALTGDPFFPGGMGEFFCSKNEFLVFEKGPSVDITLQWATYRDASDQCSLSRIWGGIHPPVDDIPGRLIGIKIGLDAFSFAKQFFSKTIDQVVVELAKVYPNPATCVLYVAFDYEGPLPIHLFKSNGELIFTTELIFTNNGATLILPDLTSGVYILSAFNEKKATHFTEKIVVN